MSGIRDRSSPAVCHTDGANGLQSIADRLPFLCTPVLDWFHISMRVRYLEQIVKGMRAKTETEKAARGVLISRIDRLRWCFWHAQLEKAKNRMQGILTLCRVIVPETPGVADSLAPPHWTFPVAALHARNCQALPLWRTRPSISGDPRHSLPTLL